MNVRVRHGMVLAAGRGERMRPLTDTLPKPMIAVGGRPMLDRAIDALEAAGVEKVVVNTSYKAEIIEAHLRQRATSNICFSYEAEALETGGGIQKALPLLGEGPFFVVNGDVIWLNGKTPALMRLAAAWKPDYQALLLVHPVEKSVGYSGKGDFMWNEEQGLVRRGEAPTAPYVYAGVQLLSPSLFDSAPKGAFSLNILYDWAIRSDTRKIAAVIHDGEWLHVGDVAGKEQAEQVLAATTTITWPCA